MLVLEYKEENIYKYLKHFNHKYIGKKIGIFSSQMIDSWFFNRLQLYTWNEKNKYYYILNNVNEQELNNLLNCQGLFYGVVYNLSEELITKENFNYIRNFCLETGLDFSYNQDNLILQKWLKEDFNNDFR